MWLCVSRSFQGITRRISILIASRQLRAISRVKCDRFSGKFFVPRKNVREGSSYWWQVARKHRRDERETRAWNARDRGCVGRKIREFASCASDATRELTTHASYRAHYYPIYRRVFIPLRSRTKKQRRP